MSSIWHFSSSRLHRSMPVVGAHRSQVWAPLKNWSVHDWKMERLKKHHLSLSFHCEILLSIFFHFWHSKAEYWWAFFSEALARDLSQGTFERRKQKRLIFENWNHKRSIWKTECLYARWKQRVITFHAKTRRCVKSWAYRVALLRRFKGLSHQI